MTHYVAARREFVAACSQVQEQQQRASDDASLTNSNAQQLYAKCEEVVAATHSHCDSQLKAWQQQRAQLLQSHAQAIQQLQVLCDICDARHRCVMSHGLTSY
jgi:hypothetical protein